MGWKDWSYAKRGALIGLIVAIVYVPLSFYDPGCPIDNCSLFKEFSLNILHFSLLQLYAVLDCSGDSCFIFAFLWSPLLALIELILLGALIGWIYGKIKNRRKEKKRM